jgi:GNAT superfamily N-acetyltransferase
MILGMQFMAQRGHYRASYPQAIWSIVERKGEAIGRLCVDKGALGAAKAEDAWLLVDIALMPDWSGQGIGSAVLDRLIAEAKAAGKPIRLTVRQENPARRLYRAKGFVETGFEGPDIVMTRPA